MRNMVRVLLVPAVLFLGGAPAAWAMLGDTFTFNAGATQQTDSNLFRLPANANTRALIGKPSAEENIGVTSLGFNLSKPYSLQRFELGYNLIDYRYQNFSYLNFTANNYNAAWRWALTPRLTGNLTAERSETLNSFLDYQGYNQRNRRTLVNNRFDAAYALLGELYFVAGVTRSTLSNEQTVLALSDYSAVARDFGLRYLLASGSSLSFTHKNTDGNYLNRSAAQVSQFGDSFQQIDNGLQAHWIISGHSMLDLSAAQISRSQPNLPQYDFSGVNTAVNYNWSPTGKIGLTAGWERDLSNYQTGSFSYVQADRFSVGPVWQFSPKTFLRMSHVITLRDYFVSAGQVASQRSDTLRDTSLSLNWIAHQRLTLTASLQKSSRSSNLPGLDYDSTLSSLSAQLTY